MVTAILLAGGTSSRMGGNNKLLLPYRDQTVIQCVATELHLAGLFQVIAVIGYEANLVQAALQPFPFELVINLRYQLGMTTSIQRGVRAATGTGFMICLADMVKLTAGEYAQIAQAFDKQYLLDPKCICLPVFGKKRGNPVILSSWYKDAILAHKDMEGCREIVQANLFHLHLIPMETPHILQDIDDPADYQALTSKTS